MTDGVSFLRGVKQNYIQYNVMWPVNISSAIYNYCVNGVPENECMMIYKGWAPTIEISSRLEYERFKKVNSDDDYRVYEDGILFCTDDMNKINGVVSAYTNYHNDKNYVALMDGMIESLKPSVELKRTNDNN